MLFWFFMLLWITLTAAPVFGKLAAAGVQLPWVSSRALAGLMVMCLAWPSMCHGLLAGEIGIIIIGE
jgi:hypothetical protein